jgi:hypothetical protein
LKSPRRSVVKLKFEKTSSRLGGGGDVQKWNRKERGEWKELEGRETSPIPVHKGTNL